MQRARLPLSWINSPSDPLELVLHDLHRVLHHHVDIQRVLVMFDLLLARRVMVVPRLGTSVPIATLVAGLGTLLHELIGVLEPPPYGTDESGLDRPLLLVVGVPRPGALVLPVARPRHAEAEIARREIEDKFGANPDWDHFDYYYHRQNKILSGGAGAGGGEDECPWPRDADDEEERSVKSRLVGPIRGRFKHAYQLVKQGPQTCDKGRDRYRRPKSRNDHDASGEKEIEHDKNTLYVNVVVKNSVQVVQHELQRIAR